MNMKSATNANDQILPHTCEEVLPVVPKLDKQDKTIEELSSLLQNMHSSPKSVNRPIDVCKKDVFPLEKTIKNTKKNKKNKNKKKNDNNEFSLSSFDDYISNFRILDNEGTSISVEDNSSLKFLASTALETCIDPTSKLKIGDIVSTVQKTGVVPREFLELIAQQSFEFETKELLSQELTEAMYGSQPAKEQCSFFGSDIENMIKSGNVSNDFIDMLRETSNGVKEQGMFDKYTANVVNETVENFNKDTGIVDDLKELLCSLKKTSEKANSTTVESLLKTLFGSQTMKDAAQGMTKGLLSTMFFIGLLFVYRNERTKKNLGLLALSFLAMLYFTNMLGGIPKAMELFGLLKKISSEAAKEQSYSDIFTTVASLALSSQFYGMCKSPTDQIFGVLKSLTGVKGSLGTIYESVVSAVEKVINYVRVEFLHKERISLLAGNLVEIDFYIHSVQKIMDSENVGEFYKTTENFLILENLRNEGQILLTKIKMEPKNSSAVVMARSAHSNICKLIRDFQARNISSAGNRQEPVGVLLLGGSGVGKSMTMEHICSAFCAETMTVSQLAAFQENRSNWIFNYQSENGYFDGYQPTTHVTYFDEMFQARDVAGKPDAEPMTLIRMLNSFEMALNFARLEMKGNVKFHSKMVIGTSNSRNFSFPSIVDPEAVIRRLHVKVVVVPKDEYCLDKTKDLWNRKFDFSKVGEGALHIDHQDFYLQSDDGKTSTVPIDFDQLMQLVFKEYANRVRYHEDNIAAFKVTQEKYKSQKKEVVEEKLPTAKEQSSVAFQTKVALLHQTTNTEYFGADIDDSVIRLKKYVSTLSVEDFNKRLSCMLSAMYSIYNKEELEHMSTDDKFAILAEDLEGECLPAFKYMDYKDLLTEDVMETVHACGKMRVKLPVMKYAKLDTESFFDKFMSGTTFAYNKTVAFLKSIVPYLEPMLFLGGIMLGSYTVVALIRSFFPSYSGEQSLGASDKMHSPKGNKMFSKGSAALKASVLGKEQAGEYDSNGSDIARSVLATNSFFLYIGDKMLGSVLFVKGRVAVMPIHYLNRLVNKCAEENSFIDTVVYLRKSPFDKKNIRDVELVCKVKDLIEGMEFSDYSVSQDFCFVQFPRQINEKRNIIQYFLLEADLSRFENNIHFILGDGSGNQTRGLAREHTGLIVETECGENKEISHSYTYMASTVEGSCGSVFFTLNPNVEKRKIAGIHIAGHANGFGFSTVLTQEVIEAHLKPFGDIVDVVESDFVAVEQSKDFDHTQLIQVGTSKKKFSNGVQTAIIKSPLYNNYGFKPITCPTKVRPFYNDEKELIDPMKLAVSKFVYPKKYVDQDMLERVSLSYSDFIEHSTVRPVERRLLTFSEVLDGNPSDADMKGLNLSTSSGFTVKNELIDIKKLLHLTPKDSEAYKEYSSKLFQDCHDLIEMYRQHKRPYFVYMMCPKDERKEKVKVAQGKLRAFAACEFRYQLIFIKYFGAFLLMMKKNKIYNHCGIGINPYSEDWTQLSMKLSQFDRDGTQAMVGAGDYSHFDGSAMEQIHFAILDVINRWYNDGNDHIRYMIWLEITNSKQLIENVVAEFCGSMPSGNPGTTSINCMYNEFAFRLSWCKLNLPLHEFDTHLYVIFYGDDNAFTVHPRYRHVFNELTLAGVMKEIGLEYTTELKSTAVFPFRKIGNIEFIKRSFVFDRTSSLWLAPLRLDVVLEIPCWTKRKDSLTITTDNVEVAIRELSLHSKDIFDAWVPAIVACYKDKIPFAQSSKPWNTNHAAMREIVSKAEYYLQ